MNDLRKQGDHRRAIVLRVFLIILCVGLAGGTAMAQEEKATKVILFKDGTSVTGKIVEMNINTIKVQTADGAIVVRKFDDVEAINDPRDIVKQTALQIPVHSFDIGAEVFWKNYEERDISVKESGMMYGAALAYTYHKNLMARLSLLLAYGEVDYQNSGQLDDIEDQMMEVRGIIGYDFYVTPTAVITPYFGLAYRYLNDDSSGMISTTGARGYERESNYIYSPIGVEFTSLVEGGWRIGFSAEVDFLWYGVQKSHLSDADPRYPDLSNDQDTGYGLRGSFKVQKRFDSVSLLVEPFVRYWTIKDSDYETFYVPGVGMRTGYEPKNITSELGCRVAMQF
jgi:Autotransporter beta-domain